MPASPFQDEEPDNKNLVKTYQNRTAQVAVQVWDWEGNLLSRLEVQDEFYLFALSPNGKTLYAVKIDNDHLFWAKLPDIG